MRKYILWALALCLNAAVACPAGAATLRVGPDDEYPTIMEAVEAAADGDTLLVAPGEYPENVDIDKPLVLLGPNSGTAPWSPVRGEEAVVNPETGRALIFSCGCQGAVVDGLAFAPKGATALLSTLPGTAVEIRNNLVEGDSLLGGGAARFDNMAGLQFQRNWLRGIAQSDTAALHVRASNEIIIEDNRIESSLTVAHTGAGVRLDGVESVESFCIVSGNRIRYAQHSGVSISDRARRIFSLTVTENEIDSCNLSQALDHGGVRIDGAGRRGVDGLNITHNIVADCHNGLTVANGSQIVQSTILVLRNDFGDNFFSGFYHGGNGVLAVQGNWWGDENGPQHPENPLGTGGSRIRELSAGAAAYAPWLGAFDDEDAQAPGYQRENPEVWALQKSAPKENLLNISIALAGEQDTLIFKDRDYSDENIQLYRSLHFASEVEPLLGNFNVFGDTTLKTLSIEGDFQIENLILTTDTGGVVRTGTDTLILNGRLTESAENNVEGILRASRPVGRDASDFGGIGAEVGPGADNLGDVTVVRVNGPLGPDTLSEADVTIARYWHVSGTAAAPASGREIALQWPSTEDNDSDPATARVIRKASPAENWAEVAGPFDVSAQDPRQVSFQTRSFGFFTVIDTLQCAGFSADAGPRTAVCAGSSDTLKAVVTGGAGALSGGWLDADGIESIDDSLAVVSPDSNRFYYYEITDENGCVASDSIFVTVAQLPNIKFQKSSYTVCRDEAVKLRATGGVSYRWSPGATLNDSTVSDPFAAPLNDQTYQVVVTGGNGCVDSAEVLVEVWARPTVTATAETPLICAGDSAFVEARGAIEYRWTPENSLDDPTSRNPVAKPESSLTFTIIGFDENGCSDTTGLPIRVQPLPEISAGRDVEICAGQTTELNGSGGVEYFWQPFFQSDRDQDDLQNPRITPLFTRTYTLVGTDRYGCDNIDTVRVVVRDNPQITFITFDGTICPGGELQLNVDFDRDVAIEWSPANGLSDTDVPNPLARPAQSTRYTVSGVDSFGCRYSETVDVTVSELPSIEAGLESTICPGQSAELAVFEKKAGNNTYEWFPKENVADAFAQNTTASPENTTTYTVVATNEDLCSVSREQRVNVVNEQAPSFGPDRVMCPGESVTLFVTGAERVAWSPQSGLDDPNSRSPQASPFGTTDYVAAVQSAGGCEYIDTITVVVVSGEEVRIRPGREAPFCEGGAVRLSTIFDPQASYMGFQWLKDGEEIRNAVSPNYDATEPGNYQLEVRVNGCDAVSPPTRVYFAPAQPVSAGGDQAICRGGTGTRLMGEGEGTFSWRPAFGLSNPNSPQPIANPSVTTTYTLTVTDALGCRSTDEATITLSGRPAPRIDAPGELFVCEGEEVVLRAFERTSPFAQYHWQRNGQFIEEYGDSIVSTDAATYRIIASIRGCAPVASGATQIFRLENAVADAGPEVINCAGGPGTTLRTTWEGQEPFTFEWTPQTGLNVADAPFPVANPATSRVYTFTVRGANGCPGRDEVRVRVFDEISRPVILPRDSVKFCEGDSAELRVNYTEPAFRYRWIRNSDEIADANEPVLKIKGNGVYRVEVTTEGCPNSLSDPKIVETAPPFDVSVVTEPASCAACPDGFISVTPEPQNRDYSYTFMGILEYSTRFVRDVRYGTYPITVSDQYGCTETVYAVVDIQTSRPESAEAGDFKLYPNPTSGDATLRLPETWANRELRLQLTDLAGKIVWESRTQPAAEIELDFGGAPSGAYWLRLEDAEGKTASVPVVIAR